jgi:hypothetical protein
VRVFVKQVGFHPLDNGSPLKILGNNKGGDMADWPKDIRVREFPSSHSIEAEPDLN